jgi:dienelactone hydrolase
LPEGVLKIDCPAQVRCIVRRATFLGKAYVSVGTTVWVLISSLFLAGCAKETGIKPAPTNQGASPVPSATAPSAQPERVSFRSADGVEIVGSFYPSPDPKSPAILMMHQWLGNRGDYAPLAESFQSAGFNVFSIDGRGFGESTRRGADTVRAGRTSEDVAGMLDDVNASVDFLAHQANVDANRLGIIGASYGSSLAIIHAARDPRIKAVTLLSPGLNYFGNLATEEPVREYGPRPLLIVAAEDDPESTNDSRVLDKAASGSQHQLKIYPTGGHGTDLLKSQPTLGGDLLDFFRAAR